MKEFFTCEYCKTKLSGVRGKLLHSCPGKSLFVKAQDRTYKESEEYLHKEYARYLKSLTSEEFQAHLKNRRRYGQ